MTLQKLWFADDGYKKLEEYMHVCSVKRVMIVHGASYNKLRISKAFGDIIARNEIQVVHFTEFSPNPDVAAVLLGVRLLQKEKPDFLMAVGGGSALDVAKCIKLYGKADTGVGLLSQKNVCEDVPFAVLPTTAGTGSETTRFAVIYENGEKQSVTSQKFIPDIVLFDSSVLEFLPMNQRKATFLDALSHAVESYWSVNASEVSRAYAEEAIRLLMANTEYIDSPEMFERYDILQYAAYLAGKAINISQTTAGHAMCYKLTSIFGISHGQAAALCMTRLWRYMESVESVKGILNELSRCMGYVHSSEAILKLEDMLKRWDMAKPLKTEEETDYMVILNLLSDSVNPTRLKNHPVQLSKEIFRELYRKILTGVF